MAFNEFIEIIGLKMLIKFKYNQNWPEWYNFLRYYFSILGIWNKFNPNSDNAIAISEPIIFDFVKKFTKALD
jgi:hypothetical protein